ncbi:MAG: metal-dependent hydrolase [Tepidibacillus sp.]
MTGPTHLIVGLTSAVYLGYSSPTQLAVVGIASLLPDIDRKNSLLGRVIPFLPTVLQAIGKRTITHSIWMIIGLSILIYSLKAVWLIPFLIGYSSHILLDAFSGMVHILFPIPFNLSFTFGIPPVFMETGLLVGMGVFFAFNWHDFLTKVSFLY